MSDLLLVCRLTLICVLAVAGLAKLRDRRRFAAALDGFPFLPAAARPALAVLVPAAELAAAVLLVVPATVLAGLGLAAVLCAGFCAVAVTALRHGTSAACPCFGSRTAVPMGPWHVARNAVLTGLALLGGAIALTHGTSTPADMAAVALAAAAAAYLAVFAVFTDDLAAFLSAPPRPGLSASADSGLSAPPHPTPAERTPTP
ncbi:MauE/DoxX family redox-associated membrane protein [Streptomyces indicus]|uniref:Methylamine utilisation protein MauE n=1 Tax=Streptomyces indicus TaxID=417292 RepID=A0A1G9G1G3_9ACTN|nr:MauE/DoxX family redox-associated membrane protein [Streptomyces indicus]SDK94447.1 Methylamine utilisation protein MauE [Streptomyces indicus]